MKRAEKAALPLRQVVQEHARAAYRETILDAVARLLVRVGFGALKMSEIAAEAGVSVGTLYHYFDSKEAVIAALVTRENDLFFASVEGSQAEEPLGRLRCLVTQAFRFLDERGALFAVFTQLNATSEADLRRLMGADTTDAYVRFRDLLVRDLTAAARVGVVRSDYPPEALGAALGGLLSATIYQWVSQGRERPLAERADACLDLFLHGATPP